MTDLLRHWIAMGRSMIIASHVLHEIEALTQSFLLISGGRVLASGTAEEVHELLFDVPLEIHVQCNDLRGFTAKTLAADLADSAKIRRTNSGGEMVVLATRHAGRIAALIPKWMKDDGLQINEIRTADDSLQSLFNSLMKIHRGEL